MRGASRTISNGNVRGRGRRVVGVAGGVCAVAVAGLFAFGAGSADGDGGAEPPASAVEQTLKLPPAARSRPESDQIIALPARSEIVKAEVGESEPPPARSEAPSSGEPVAASADAGAPPETTETTDVSEAAAAEPTVEAIAASASVEPEPAPEPEPARWQELTVHRGDTLAELFERAGLTARDVYEVVNADDEARALTRIYPGDVLALKLSPDDELLAVRYETSAESALIVARTEDGYQARTETIALERRVSHARGEIQTSLFAAGADAGLEDELIMELAGIFGWDIDFALDIRRGDRFEVVYEELYRDGEKVRNGDILSARFTNDGETFRAVRYENPKGRVGYFTPDGRSMRKEFLRSPVNFAYVSSNFNPQRYHPVLGVKRPHMGTDYAARPGTPIKAAGDGKIIHLGRKGGYGRTIIIQHGTRYTTLYAHMSGYRRGLSGGDRVKQGQVIGYVGSSGLVTGPHLHYEFRVDGSHRNPRTVDLPDAEPIQEEYLADFRSATAPLLAQLDSFAGTSLAQADGD